MGLLEAIKYQSGNLTILDQLKLPHQVVYLEVKDAKAAWDVIRNMNVRGAPAIGIVALLSMAVEITNDSSYTQGRGRLIDKQQLMRFVEERSKYLCSARPTAVNIFKETQKVIELCQTMFSDDSCTLDEMKSKIISHIEDVFAEDVSINKAIGDAGAKHMAENITQEPKNILTHCNTGSLATAGYGTALGVIRSLHAMKHVERAYCTETRPYNQGARLTAYELQVEQIPATLICDDMVGALMQQKKIHAVVVGADRVVANGDTANKIGTYQIAVLAKYHGVPFYVASPLSTIDLTLETGQSIKIEERPQEEVRQIGGVEIAPADMVCWNPAFDVTPAELITGGIITEIGVFKPDELKAKLNRT